MLVSRFLWSQGDDGVRPVSGFESTIDASVKSRDGDPRRRPRRRLAGAIRATAAAPSAPQPTGIASIGSMRPPPPSGGGVAGVVAPPQDHTVTVQRATKNLDRAK